jgi:hypothetical protein
MRQIIIPLGRVGLFLGLFATNAFCDEPSELSRLRTQWLEVRSKAVVPLDKKYLLELENLKTKFTKAGNLDAALAVDKELRLKIDKTNMPSQSASGSQQIPKSPTGSWKSRWQTRQTGVFTFDKEGKVSYSGEKNSWAAKYSDGGWFVERKTEDGKTEFLERFTVVGERKSWPPMFGH